MCRRQGGPRGESPQGHRERLCLERKTRLATAGREHHNKTSITGQVLWKKNVFVWAARPTRSLDREGGVSAMPNAEETEMRRHGGMGKVLDRIDRIIEVGSPRLSNLVNPVNPVKKTPCLTNSVTSAFSAAGNPCSSGFAGKRSRRVAEAAESKLCPLRTLRLCARLLDMEGGVSATLNAEETEMRRHGGVGKILDRIDRIIEVCFSSFSNLVNPVNPVKKTPRLTNSVISAFSAAGNPCTVLR